MRQSPKKKTSISILLSLSLPLLYLSLLHTSPSNLIKDTTFWFLLSNSIIFIVAVDSGVFSAPDELIHHSNGSNNGPPNFFIKQYYIRDNVKVKKKSLSYSEIDAGSVENEMVVKSLPAKKLATLMSSSSSEIDEGSVDNEVMVKSSPEVKLVAPASSSDEEESEYWKMSDEELNKRVEEFIRKFNRELSSNR